MSDRKRLKNRHHAGFGGPDGKLSFRSSSLRGRCCCALAAAYRAGLLLGHGLVFLAGPIVETRSDILIDPWFFEKHELYILPALLVLAVIVGLVPGLTAYRADVAKGLSD